MSLDNLFLSLFLTLMRAYPSATGIACSLTTKRAIGARMSSECDSVLFVFPVHSAFRGFWLRVQTIRESLWTDSMARLRGLMIRG
ncbi:hypothetical protein CC79DRAFT_1074407 [Sarocladium strictum]